MPVILTKPPRPLRRVGSNLGLMAPDLAPVEAAIGGDGNVVDEGVPGGAGDPIQEEKED